jgi:hypothetical protein
MLVLALLLAGCGGIGGSGDMAVADLDSSDPAVCSSSSQCAPGEACRINQCITDPCATVSCSGATFCDDAQCVPLAGNLCDGVTCSSGECEVLTGAQVCSRP